MEISILTVIRIFLFAMTNMMGATYIVGQIEEKRRSYYSIAIFWMVKIFIQIAMCNYILVELYGQTQWLSTLRLGVACVYAVLVYVAYYWTFRGDPLHIAIVAFVVDIIISFIGFIGIAAANILAGNRDVWLIMDDLKITDFVMPAISGIIIFVLCKVLRPLMEKLKKWTPKRRKIWWTIFAAYVISVSLTNLDPYIKLSFSIIAGIILYALSIIILVMIFIKYENRVKKERKVLRLRQNMMENHYEIMQGQIQKMEKSREVIAEQMQEILDTEGNANSEKMKNYLDQLKTDYENIQAGIYCDDWMIDAVICSQKRILESKGIIFECNIHKYDRGQIKEQDLAQILLTLLSYAENAEKTERVYLAIKELKNQLVMEYMLPVRRKDKLLKRAVGIYLEKYDGSIEFMDTNKEIHLIIMMKKR